MREMSDAAFAEWTRVMEEDTPETDAPYLRWARWRPILKRWYHVTIYRFQAFPYGWNKF